jgi:beta-galactosidase
MKSAFLEGMTLFKQLLHGADYNPDQWLDVPGIIDADFKLLKQANMNAVSLGIFSWASLEPEEGRYSFDWMDDIFARAEKAGVGILLATPSGGKPRWLGEAYPEVRRMDQRGHREPQVGRHNHCLTSPVYREKVFAINTELARRYGRHPSLVAWHISNEYGGHCHCPLCMAAFQDWLKARYGDLDTLNRAWWSHFWSHTYTAWEQINAIDTVNHGLELDWKRFMTHQCRSFIRNEIAAIRPHSPDVPVTTNLMPFYDAYDFGQIAQELDVVSWDSYPQWHTLSTDGDETRVALQTAFCHDSFRGMKPKRPFLLLESTPSQVNWSPVAPLKRPGVHRLGSLQAIAHGSDSVCYFQFRKGRGCAEKFHGAVVDHVGHGETRVFREVAALGKTMTAINGIAGGTVEAPVALIFDAESRWAFEQSRGPQNSHKAMNDTAIEFYRPFWERGIAVDVVDQCADLSAYRLVLAPIAYLLRPGFAEKLTAFAEQGGTVVATYCTGMVDEHDLCFNDGFPGPLKPLFGIWAEEIDALPEGHTREVIAADGQRHGLSGSYKARDYCELVHAREATVLATYGNDFYAGSPAVTVNTYGKGQAYYIASRNETRFQDDLLGTLADQLNLPKAVDVALPAGVTAHRRKSLDGGDYLFWFNYTAKPVATVWKDSAWVDAETGEPVSQSLQLPPYASRIFRKKT